MGLYGPLNYVYNTARSDLMLRLDWSQKALQTTSATTTTTRCKLSRSLILKTPCYVDCKNYTIITAEIM